MRLGYSFCPNDTFIFYALVHGKVPGPRVSEVLEDVETLNRWALRGELELTKVSYRTYLEVCDRYVALRAGGALGRGVGPLVLTARPRASLDGCRVAVPGRLTTAFLLLQLRFGTAVDTVEMRYDEILPALVAGAVDAGVIIHESRFTYPQHGLHCLLDLGAWWEAETGLPLPLGCILARRDLSDIAAINEAVEASLRYAYAHPDEPREYIRRHAQELEPDVIQAHIDLYVNDFSLDVGEQGERAVHELFERARRLGIGPARLPRIFEPRFERSAHGA